MQGKTLQLDLTSGEDPDHAGQHRDTDTWVDGALHSQTDTKRGHRVPDLRVPLRKPPSYLLVLPRTRRELDLDHGPRHIANGHVGPALESLEHVVERLRAIERERHPVDLIGADRVDDADVDVVVLGTGFEILDLPIASRVLEGAGRSLAEHWQGSPQAYLGTAVSGFPNFFNLLGPNLGTGHTSAFMILEAQLDHVLGAVTRLLGGPWTSLDLRPERQAAFVAAVQSALRGTVYETGGCTSYYHDVNGRNSFSWPWSSGHLRTEVGRFDASAYRTSA